jgi:hypothetical protein
MTAYWECSRPKYGSKNASDDARTVAGGIVSPPFGAAAQARDAPGNKDKLLRFMNKDSRIMLLVAAVRRHHSRLRGTHETEEEVRHR